MAEEKYLNCIFEGIEFTPTKYGLDYVVFVKEKKLEGSIEILFTEKISYTLEAIAMLGWDNKQTAQEIKRMTFARAKARLALGEYTISEEYEKKIDSINTENSKKQGSFDEEIIQSSLLKSLRNIRQIKPESFEYEQIDVEGFCELLNISRDVYLYIAGILKENNFIEEGKIDQLTIENGGIFITNKGIDNLKELRVNSCGPLAKMKCDCKKTIKNKFASNKIFLDIPYFDYSECEEVLREILKEGGLQAIVAKDRLTSNAVLCKICAMIQTCKYGLSDISSASNSVSYEYGLMHGFGMKVCLLLREASEKFTDIHGLEHISYVGLSSFKINVCKWLLENVKEINKEKIQEIVDVEEKLLLEKKESPLKNISRVDINENAVIHDRKEKIIADIQTRNQNIMDKYHQRPFRLIYTFPSKTIAPITDLKSLLSKKEKLVLPLKKGGFFPCRPGDMDNSKNSLLYCLENPERSYTIWYEVDINGLIYFKETIYEYEEETKKTAIDAFVTLKKLILFFALASEVYKTMGYLDTIEIKHEFQNIHGLKLLITDNIRFSYNEGKIRYDNNINFCKTVNVEKLQELSNDTILEIYEQARASAGMGKKAFDRELTSKQLQRAQKKIF